MTDLVPTDPPEVAAAMWDGIGGQLAFDVGAHLGENFRFLRAGGAKRIIAFEPEVGLFDHLLYAEDDVEPVCAAVGAVDGLLELRRANGMLGDLAGDEQVTSDCVTLDAAAARYGTPDVVVVDVEGFEDRVLAGATGLLTARCVSWLIEFHTEPLYVGVCAVLLGAGYAPQVVRHPHYPPGSGLWRGHGWVKALRP